MSEMSVWMLVWLVLVLLVAVGVPALLFLALIRAVRKGTRKEVVGYTGLAVLALLISGSVAYRYLPLGGNRVARLQSADGMELMVYQLCGFGWRPYTTCFYVRKPDGVWNAFILEEDDRRWTSGRIRYFEDDRSAVIYRGRRSVALFDAKNIMLMVREQWSRPDRTLPEGVQPGQRIDRKEARRFLDTASR